jgi:transcriptional regulator with XRE-family HTH domain
MKRITRKRHLSREDAGKYKTIREKVSAELPDILDRHLQRMTALDQLHHLLKQLKTAREAKGLSLADLTELTGMDRSALSKLEKGQRANPQSILSCAMRRRSVSAWSSLWPTPINNRQLSAKNLGTNLGTLSAEHGEKRTRIVEGKQRHINKDRQPHLESLTR